MKASVPYKAGDIFYNYQQINQSRAIAPRARCSLSFLTTRIVRTSVSKFISLILKFLASETYDLQL